MEAIYYMYFKIPVDKLIHHELRKQKQGSILGHHPIIKRIEDLGSSMLGQMFHLPLDPDTISHTSLGRQFQGCSSYP